MRKVDIALAAAAALAGLGAFGLWNAAAIASLQFPKRTLPQIAIQASPETFPRDFEATARHHVARDPLHQGRFNALYVYKASLSPEKIGPLNYRLALAGMGWRSTGAQMNLLHAAAVAEDYPAMLRRTDALLRRGVATDEVMNVLFLLEQQGDIQPQIAARLSQNPQWRREFFVNDRGYNNNEAVLARQQTIGYLERTGARPSADELAPMLANMVDRGDVENAYGIWRKLGENAGQKGLLSDSEFSHAARHSEIGTEPVSGNAARQSPFAWRLVQGDGFDAIVDSNGRSSVLRLRWDGNGVPILVTQRLRATAKSLELHLMGPNAQPQILGQLNFVLRCEGRETLFDRLLPSEGEVIKIAAAGVRTVDFQNSSFALALTRKIWEDLKSSYLK